MSCVLVESFDVFPRNTVQLPFHFEAFFLGFVEVVLHFFDQVSCFVLLLPSLSKLPKLVSDHSSFSFFLFFVHDCSLNHVVQFGFSFRTFLTAFVPRICLFFHSFSAEISLHIPCG